MLKGNQIVLKPVRDTDIDQLYDFHLDIANRGEYFPVGVTAEPLYKRRYQETGFWQKDEGMLVIATRGDEIIGHIEFFRTVSYLDELELSYHIYSKNHQGKGIATEAVTLLTKYLFYRLKYNRIRLIIHPENLASKRVAEKSGYVSEGIARGAWYNKGRSQDVEIYAITRSDVNFDE